MCHVSTITNRATHALFVTVALLLSSCAGCDAPSITLTPASATLLGGQRQEFTARVLGVSNTEVSWSVEESGGGSINGQGVYTAPYGKGTYHVKATSVENPELSATAEVTVSGSVSGLIVTVAPASATVGAGDQLQFVASVAGGSSAAVNWSIMEGTAGGTVTATGLYTAPATAGTYHVVASAESDPGAYAIAEVTVTSGSSINVTVNPATKTLGVLETQQFTATVTGTTDTGVTWSVQEQGGGTISATGLYTPPTTPGTYRVVAASKVNPSRTATATVTVTPVSVTLSPATVTLEVGTTQQFNATVNGASTKTVLWSILEGANGGNITSTGLYTPPSTPGTYRVVATSTADAGKSATAVVTVIEPITVTVSPQTANLTVSQNLQFSAAVTGSTNQTVTWSVQQGAAGGTINASGLYTAPANVQQPSQTFTVVATWTFGGFTKKGQAAVTVSPGVGITLTPSAVTLSPGGTQAFTATVTGNANTQVTWGVDEGASGGTVDASGNYTAPSTSGTYHVRATSKADTSKFAVATVVVLAPPVSISGTVTYGGALTGRVYVLVAPSDDAPGIVGTSVQLANGSAPFTIQGLQARGSFRIRAFMDTTGTGTYHKAAQKKSSQSFSELLAGCYSFLADPFASAALPVQSNTAVTGVALGLQDADWNCLTATDTPSALTVVPFDEGILALYDDGSSTQYEVCPRYTLHWGPQPGPRNGQSASSMTFDASTPNMVVKTGFTNGTPVYFSLTCTDATLGGYADFGPVTPAANAATTGTFTLSGTVNGTGLTLTNAPLILAALSETGGKVLRISSPSAVQPFTLPGVAPGSYKLYAVRDVGGNGEFTLTDPSNFSAPIPAVVSNANVTGVQVPLSSANAVVRITTRHVNDRGSESYGMSLSLRPNLKRPVKARITAGAKLSVPVDLPLVDFGGGLHGATFELGGITPAAGDAYALSVTYSDGSTETLTGQVTAVLPVVRANAPVGGITNATPLFSWSGPTPAPTGTWFQDLEVIGYETSKIFSGGFVDEVVGYSYGLPPSTQSLPWAQLTRVSGFTGMSNNFLDSYDWALTATDDKGNWSRTVTTFYLQ